MTNVKRLLQAYQIKPTEITSITKRLYKIQSHQYTFALKRASIPRDRLNIWQKVYQMGNQHQLSSILPVYLTKKIQIYEEHEKEIYYLTPWKEKKESDEPSHEIESFYRSIGKVHNQTKKEQTVQVDQLEQFVSKEKQLIVQYRQKLLRYVERFEKKHYMSPFELRVCMQYRDLDYLFRQIDYWYDYYLEDITQEKIAFLSLCHGNLRRSHLIYQSSETYFVNWEHAFLGSSMNDLAGYYYNEFKYHDCYLSDMMESFSVYEKYNSLLQSERSLLAVILLNPKSYVHLIERYAKGNLSSIEPFQIRRLEYNYRRLMHGLSFQDFLYRTREAIKEKEMESTD
ncbi:hypothetical protein NC661_02125 [Aquibacillus koreensis]|uniref:Spore coat protein YsxE n=1 Tax=Aquibacillus koreensis TaxID=279446 RepID=A0A9X3WIK9_9BACI|nr:hypothetical protein [Aquibacillus koreensis]MCT2537934.1 hypothetical protein [Aquibacillus koreensis]MDC3419175.1 hypothetical protein [Aquibacillus koreensis]